MIVKYIFICFKLLRKKNVLILIDRICNRKIEIIIDIFFQFSVIISYLLVLLITIGIIPVLIYWAKYWYLKYTSIEDFNYYWTSYENRKSIITVMGYNDMWSSFISVLVLVRMKILYQFSIFLWRKFSTRLNNRYLF